MPNDLINESSPYLLQHAHNPVNWYAWNNETLARATKENKLILVSIGYSACHWCHVMEHESFEDIAVAEIMNAHFINIKVDREERPDIDMVYMGAVQLMTGHGGWPLNCFALPDGRPIYGGTYFPKHQWVTVLENLAALHKEQPEKAIQYAVNLKAGLEQLEMPKTDETKEFELKILQQSISKWKHSFDMEHGGPNRAPKFPLPNNYLFLLYYNFYNPDVAISKHLKLTLTKLAWGGIYDQLGGGFARYSTDIYWKVPHFEKMLYDNAQLISLYTQAFKQTQNPLFKKVIYETISFIEQEFKSGNGGYFSALDADSEGIEGKYYVWEKVELENLLGNKFEVFADYYCVNDIGYWEEENYVLMRNDEETKIVNNLNITVGELTSIIDECKQILLRAREKRIKPGLDNKILASWNGLLIKGLAEASLVFGDTNSKKICLQAANFITENYCLPDGRLWRIKNNNTSIHGFLDDYAFVVDAFLMVYLIACDEKWLKIAKQITDYAIANFYDNGLNVFFYTDKSGERLIVRKAEWSDNVIPASSSQMAINLNKLALYFEEPNYKQISDLLLKAVLPDIEHYGQGYSNWAILLMENLTPPTQVVIVGKNVNEILLQLYNHCPPNVIFAVSASNSEMPLIVNRYVDGETNIYICKNKNCLLPVQTVDAAIKHLEQTN